MAAVTNNFLSGTHELVYALKFFLFAFKEVPRKR